ncbi:hypothetical protein KQX54_003749 [Cotesia glomerata]|uniref:F-box domain-containing protein n=1 Tax=Cotesia glomerata TaxID=32391 RepID=A0AAV7I0G0_COTGL|nr:hypothetical protein KQX54_003749 [Cotesia glomerata]
MSIYLEIYTVAPAPSRDYYGIKVLNDEIKIFHWKISNGPHKYPGVISINFSEWSEKSRDIRFIFGESTVDCIDKIVNKKYLLTLPINFINNLLKYLSINDLKNFCLVSRAAYQIIKNQVVKELIIKKLRPSLKNKTNKFNKKNMAYNWNGLSKETNDIDKRLQINQKIIGSSDKNSYQKSLKLQLEPARSVNWNKNIRSSVSDNSIKNKPTKRVNVINVPSLEEIMSKNILTNVSKEPDQETLKLRNKVKIKSQDVKFLRSNRNITPDLTSDLSRLKANDIDLDALVRKTMDEYAKSKELIDSKFNWTNDLETPRFLKNRPDTRDLTGSLDQRSTSRSSTSVDFMMDQLMSTINTEDKVDKITPWERVKLRGFKSREGKLRSETKSKFDLRREIN